MQENLCHMGIRTSQFLMGDTTEGSSEQQAKGPVGFRVPERWAPACQPNTVVVDKEQKPTIMTDVAVTANSNIRKKNKKTEKDQRLREQLMHMCMVNSKWSQW